jgi:hypothetical protein
LRPDKSLGSEAALEHAMRTPGATVTDSPVVPVPVLVALLQRMARDKAKATIAITRNSISMDLDWSGADPPGLCEYEIVPQVELRP